MTNRSRGIRAATSHRTELARRPLELTWGSTMTIALSVHVLVIVLLAIHWSGTTPVLPSPIHPGWPMPVEELSSSRSGSSGDVVPMGGVVVGILRIANGLFAVLLILKASPQLRRMRGCGMWIRGLIQPGAGLALLGYADALCRELARG